MALYEAGKGFCHYANMLQVQAFILLIKNHSERKLKLQLTSLTPSNTTAVVFSFSSISTVNCFGKYLAVLAAPQNSIK